MPSTTHAAYGDTTNNIKQAVGLFAAHMQRNSMMASMAGPMPKGTAGANATMRKQTKPKPCSTTTALMSSSAARHLMSVSIM